MKSGNIYLNYERPRASIIDPCRILDISGTGMNKAYHIVKKLPLLCNNSVISVHTVHLLLFFILSVVTTFYGKCLTFFVKICFILVLLKLYYTNVESIHYRSIGSTYQNITYIAVIKNQ